MAYEEAAQEQRRCTATWTDSIPCRASAAWDDAPPVGARVVPVADELTHYLTMRRRTPWLDRLQRRYR